MTTNQPEKNNDKKSKIIGFIIGFIVSFCLTYFLFSKRNANSNEPTSSELMQEESQQAASKLVEAAPAKPTVSKSMTKNSELDELATLLIMDLFTDSEKNRKQAKKDMAQNFYNSPAAMKALIEKCSTEFDKKDRNDNGIFQGIDVLLMVSEKSPETLQVHKEAMYAFFEKTKGQYRERTQERMAEIRSRVGE